MEGQESLVRTFRYELEPDQKVLELFESDEIPPGYCYFYGMCKPSGNFSETQRLEISWFGKNFQSITRRIWREKAPYPGGDHRVCAGKYIQGGCAFSAGPRDGTCGADPSHGTSRRVGEKGRSTSILLSCCIFTVHFMSVCRSSGRSWSLPCAASGTDR